jgi:hypothetical protein
LKGGVKQYHDFYFIVSGFSLILPRMCPKNKIALVFIFSGLISAVGLILALPSIKGQRQMTNTRIINWSSSDAKISGFFAVGEVTKNDLRRVPPAGSDREREI